MHTPRAASLHIAQFQLVHQLLPFLVQQLHCNVLWSWIRKWKSEYIAMDSVSRVIMNVHRAHQRQYPAEVIVVICKMPVNRCGTRYIPQCSTKKGLFDKANTDSTIQECINRYKWWIDNVKRWLDHKLDQGLLHGELDLPGAQNKHKIWHIPCHHRQLSCDPCQ